MTIPSNLFIDTPEVEDSSLTALNSDSSQWSEDIITKLKERIPAVGTMTISIKMMHVDDENGAGTGSISISDGKGITVVIPVLIKNFSLYPLDVVMFSGKILPLNSETFASIFAGTDSSVFSSLDEYPELAQINRYLKGESLQSAIFPPNWGRYAFASEEHTQNKKFPMLASIEDTIDGNLLKTAMPHNTLARFYSTPYYEMIQKVANTRPVNMGEFRQGTDNLVMRTLNVLTKDGPNKYTLLSNDPFHFSPSMTPCDRSAVSDFCSKVYDKPMSAMHDLDQNGEKVIIIDNSNEGDSIFVARPHTNAIVSADNFGRYSVKTTKTNVNVEGLVIPTVIDFDQNPAGSKIFLGKTFSTIQNDIYGVSMDGQSDWMPKGCRPAVGQTGTFGYLDGTKGGIATLPITVSNVYVSSNDCGSKCMVEGFDLAGKAVKLSISNDNSIQRIANMGDHYLIPSFMSWYPMEGFDPISSNEYDYALKVAGEKLTGNPIVLIDKKYGEYELRGVTKYASHMNWNPQVLSSGQAKFLMMSLGVKEASMNEAIKLAKVLGKAEIHGVNYPEIKDNTKTSSAKLESFINDNIRCNLTKVASYMENSQTLDSLLSLNFVNTDNITKFISKIPLFKAALSNLAACLLASRLGIKEIPEESTSSAIAKLSDVIKGLEILRATQQVNK